MEGKPLSNTNTSIRRNKQIKKSRTVRVTVKDPSRKVNIKDPHTAIFKDPHTATFTGPMGYGKSLVLDLIDKENIEHLYYVIIICPKLRWNKTYCNKG